MPTLVATADWLQKRREVAHRYTAARGSDTGPAGRTRSHLRAGYGRVSVTQPSLASTALH